jgi:hypothetical protein
MDDFPGKGMILILCLAALVIFSIEYFSSLLCRKKARRGNAETVPSEFLRRVGR